MLKALNDIALIKATYFEAGAMGDAKLALDRIISVTEDHELEEAVARLEAGFGLKVVK